MISVEEFTSINIGDVIETSPLFPALSTEPVCFQCVGVSEDWKLFDVSWNGILITTCEAVVKIKSGVERVAWSKKK